MEAWTFTKDNTFIRYREEKNESDFGEEWFFSESEYDPIWFVDSEELAKKAYKKWTHPFYSRFWFEPNAERINIDEWKIVKLELFSNPLT